MGVRSLVVSGLRCIEHAELDPSPGLNLVTGSNGSGKTSLLEAIFLLGRGRSFRSSQRDSVIRRGARAARVTARLAEGQNLGIEVTSEGWRARAGGQAVGQLAELAAALPVQLLDPEIHKLVQDGPGERRRYLDWATFHVKPRFLEAWRSYQRALRQRNAALRSGVPDAALRSWEAALAESGALLDRYRAETVAALAAPVNRAAKQLLDAELHLSYRPGQPAGQDLADALAGQRERDRRAGMTQAGPHRADLALSIDGHKARGWVSRGQQKLVASALVLGQAELLAPRWGARGVLLVDDPAAELDRERCASLLALVHALPFQVFLTALEPGALPQNAPMRQFHVEQGRVTQVV